MTRDLNLEFRDTETRKYAYQFDYLMHGWMLDAFRPHFSGRANCLELGAYKGEFTQLLTGEFERVTVVEGSPELAGGLSERFADRPQVTIVSSTFESFAPAAPFDHIFLIHTLEHLDYPVEVLARVREWLTPGGKLFVCVPNATAVSRQIAVEAGLIDFCAAVTPGEREHGHRKTYSLDTLAAEVRAAGLRTLDKGGVFYKALANFQLDRCLEAGIIDRNYLEGCLKLGRLHPTQCASVYCVVGR